MSDNTLSNLVDARIKLALSDAERAVGAASQAVEQASARVAEAERDAAVARQSQVDARATAKQVRDEALAQGRELADALAVKAAAIKEEASR